MANLVTSDHRLIGQWRTGTNGAGVGDENLFSPDDLEEYQASQLRGVFNVKSFGAIGNGTADDTAAIQAATTAAQAASGRLYLPLPPVKYKLTAPITLSATPIEIEGQLMGATVGASLRMESTGSQAGVFQFADSSANARFTFRNLLIDGGSKAQCGIVSATISHSRFERVRIIGTTTAAFSLGFGWDNDFLECEASSNSGDGFVMTVSDANGVNFRGCKSFSNSGWGFKIKSGHVLNLDGCTIEANAKGGIYAITGTSGAVLNIGQGTYFESNAATGYTFTTPAITVKHDILINGSNDETALAHSFPWSAVNVEGCYTNGANVSAMIGAYGATTLRIEGNGSSGSVPLVQLYGDSSIAQAPAKLIEKCNDGFSALAVLNTPTASRIVTTSEWESDRVTVRNYLTDDYLQYGVVVAGGGGSLARSALSYNGSEAFDLVNAGGTSDIFGVALDMTAYPELAGQVIAFSAWAKVSATTAGYALYCSALGATSASVASSTNWTKLELTATLPSSGTVNIGFRRISGTVGETVSFSRPVFAIAGAPRRAFYLTPAPTVHKATAAPTTGTWVVGDRVDQKTPTVGQPKGWRCTASGTPGTWVSEGNL